MTEPFLTIDAATVREEFKDSIRRLQLLPEEVAVLDDVSDAVIVDALKIVSDNSTFWDAFDALMDDIASYLVDNDVD